MYKVVKDIIIITSIFPPDHGGPASYVPTIANEMNLRGKNILAIITLSDDLEYFSDKEYEFPIIRIRRSMNRLMRMVFTIQKIYKYSKNVDIVFVNGLVLESIIACKILSRKKLVTKVVGDLIWEKYSRTKKENISLDEFQKIKLTFYWDFLRKLQKKYISLSDYIICPSKYLTKIVLDWGIDNKKVRLIYNSCPHKIENQQNQKINYDVITVCRLVPWKGIFSLIKVCERLDLSLLIVGDGPLMKSIKIIAKQSKNKITLLGHIPKDKIMNALTSAKTFVLNSSYEGLPHVVLEAKAAGVPVIATSAGGTPEIIDHKTNGLLIPVGNEKKLEQSIQIILNDIALKNKLIKNSFSQLKSFTLESQIDETLKIFDQAINNKY